MRLPNSVILLISLPLIASHYVKMRTSLVCKNGERSDGRCVCFEEYVGVHCEKKKMCESYRRRANGTCLGCVQGYEGDYCENIICVHGEVHQNGLSCVCDLPYSGLFCDELGPGDAYRFYNNRHYKMGPLGALLIIPMCAIYYGCEWMSRKKEVKRVALMLEDQTHVAVRKDTVKRLLAHAV